MNLELISKIARSTPSKIVLFVVDGLGGLPHPDTGKTELEAANIPNLSRLAGNSICGLTDPVFPGISPGSGPGHLALFGYDPVKNLIGRGVLEALGIGLELEDGDLAVRGNFCTVEGDVIVDRRAGRIPTNESVELCQQLNKIKLQGVETSVHPVKDHRFVVIFRGPGLSEDVSESDPQRTDAAPLEIMALSPSAGETARIANEFVAQAREILSSRRTANMVLLRGFSMLPHLPPMSEVYRLRPAAIASYPMYRGLAKIVGMDTLDTGLALQDELVTLGRHFSNYDFFYIHYKATDAAGEDGDFGRKVKALEELDEHIPDLLTLKPDVIVVTGDHSTPAVLAAHSWHPVPVLIHSRWCRPDRVASFTERTCASGSLGRFPATHVMPLALAYAQKLAKFGA
ncbi:MAG: 2,3-bisphosphoglycerate-independent phosphoglycerate mutase [Chloroflexi bacterium]|nr:2,3-bisphosphoglycerate-independent phosphoglycerate mutase [Chloroflexota bacterium]